MCGDIIQVRWTSLKFSGVKFPRDSVHQNVLKSVYISPSYWKYKKGKFFETQCIVNEICSCLKTDVLRILSKFGSFRKLIFKNSHFLRASHDRKYPLLNYYVFILIDECCAINQRIMCYFIVRSVTQSGEMFHYMIYKTRNCWFLWRCRDCTNRMILFKMPAWAWVAFS